MGGICPYSYQGEGVSEWWWIGRKGSGGVGRPDSEVGGSGRARGVQPSRVQGNRQRAPDGRMSRDVNGAKDDDTGRRHAIQGKGKVRGHGEPGKNQRRREQEDQGDQREQRG